MSDLHLEMEGNRNYLQDNPPQVCGDILVLAGDIAYWGDERYGSYPFWDWASSHYQQVIVGMGNHEFYNYYDLATMPNGFCHEIRPNVHVYYNAVVALQGIDIIVSTLWSKIPDKEAFFAEMFVTDFRRIKYQGELLTFVNFNQEHERCLSFVKEAVEKSGAPKKIVVSHHVPSFLLQCPQHQGSKLNGAFIVDLDHFIEDSGVDYWIYGHSHYNKEAQIGRTLCVSNQLGYVHQNEHLSFRPSKFI